MAVGDLHFSEKPPLARAERKNWLDTQSRVMRELDTMQKEYNCIVLVAGDVFDRWNATPAIINRVLAYMPNKMYGVPGNHDLPNHLYTEVDKTAYWTLVEAGKIINLTPRMRFDVEHMSLAGFTCGFTEGMDVEPVYETNGLVLSIAIIHDYIWTEKTGHTGASDKKRYGKWMKKLTGYDVAVFGDNHKGFLIQKATGVTTVLNCGTLMRRKADEIEYTPTVGLIHASGKVERCFLDCTLDKFTDVGREIASIQSTLEVDLTGFIEQMNEMKILGGNWKRTVLLWIKEQKLDKEVERLIVKAVEQED